MDKKSLKGDVIISYVSLFLTIFITFFLTKLEVNFLGKELYSVYGLVNSTIGYISILDLGIGQTVIRYISQFRAENKKEKVEQVAGNSFVNYIKVAIVGLLIGIVLLIKCGDIFGSLTSDTVDIFKICFFISLINIILQIPAATFNSVLSAYKEFRIIKIRNLVKTTVRAIGVTILLFIKSNLIFIFVIDLVLTQLMNIFNYIYMRKKLNIKLNFTPMDKGFNKEIFTYSFFIFLGIITDQIFWKTDTIILGIMSTGSIVAVYLISSQLISQYLNICSTFSSVFLPRIVDKLEEGQSKEQINKFFAKASRYQFVFVAMILTSFIFIGKDFIVLWLGTGYINAYYYVLIIMISLTVPMFQTTGYQILFAMKKHKVRSIIYLLNAIMNVGVSVLLYQVFGAFGVAMATAISMILGNTIFMNIYYKKILELKLIKFFKEVCLRTFICALITAIVYMILNKFIGLGIVQFLIKAIIANSIYLVLIFIYSLNEQERIQIQNIIKKFSNKFFNRKVVIS